MSELSLLKTTSAYKIISRDKIKGCLSHAYLIVVEDGDMIDFYSKEFAKLIMCREKEFCDDCRICRNIEKKTFSDVIFYPKSNEKITVSDVDDAISKSFFKPLEEDKKVFVFENFQNMNVQSQNKLLKTLEEPPENLILILVATNDYPILSTVKSRVKKLEIPPFSTETMEIHLSDDYEDKEKFALSLLLSGGAVGKFKQIYLSGGVKDTEKLVISTLKDMKSSREMVKYSSQISKDNIKDFMAVLKIVLRDELSVIQNKTNLIINKRFVKEIVEISKSFSEGALISVIEKINSAEKAYFFNGNVSMLADGILTAVLEEKNKWQKL